MVEDGLVSMEEVRFKIRLPIRVPYSGNRLVLTS